MHHAFAGHSHQSHIIPIEGYETKLQVLGQHVEIPETPVKVIKITKTVAVKVPVPYPVKVKEKVPYPVHVAKPYPVPVPQIIKVPHVVSVPQKDSHQSSQEGGWQSNNGNYGYSAPSSSYYGPQLSQSDEGHGRAYNVQENSQSYSPSSEGHSMEGTGSHGDSPSGSYEQGGNSYNFQGDDGGKATFAAESQAYDDALNDYFKKHSYGSGGHGGQFASGEETPHNDHSQYH